MTPDELQLLAKQLRLPTGEAGLEIAAHLNRGNAFIVKQSIERLNLTGGERVLEVGMASGYFAADILAAGPGTRYAGIDLSKTMVAAANQQNGAYVAAGWASFLEGDALNLPFGSETFDAALTVNTVYFWDPLDQALREMHRVLRPGARIAVGFRPRRLMKQYPFAPYGFTMYSGTEMAGNLENAGFSNTQVVELPEPPREFEGVTLDVATTIVSATRGQGARANR